MLPGHSRSSQVLLQFSPAHGDGVIEHDHNDDDDDDADADDHDVEATPCRPWARS